MTEVTAWPPGRPRVLVTDAWLANSGDGAIAVAVDRVVRAAAPRATLLHAAYCAHLVADWYPDLTFVPPLATLVGVAGAEPLPLGWDNASARRLVADADLVVSQGGGFLLEHYQPWERLFALAEAAGQVPLVILGQTIGEFRAARARALLRQVLRAARFVTVRESSSHAHALELGARPDHLELASDLTFLLFDHDTSDRAGTGIGVALTCHEPVVARSDGQTVADSVLAEVVARAGDEPVAVASTVQGLAKAGEQDDLMTAERAVSALPSQHRDRVTLVEGFVSSADAIAFFGDRRAVISQRLHPALFALAQGVPAALLLAADKVRVLEGAPLGHLVCETPADPAARGRSIDQAVGRGEAEAAGLWDALAPVRRRASVNLDVVTRALAEVAPS